MRISFLLLSLCLLCDLIHAQTVQIRYYGDALSNKEREKIEQIIYHEVSFYAQFGLPDTLNLNLYVFNKEADGRAYLSQYDIYPHKNTGGIFIPKQQKAVILGREKKQGKGLGIIYHELSHHFTAEITGNRPPIWFNEGLAEYFEHCTINKNNELRHTFTEYEQGRIRTLYMLGEIDLLKFINNHNHDEFMKQQQTDEQYAYILSHALISFWMEKVSPKLFKDFILTLQDRNNRSPLSDRIDRIYPGGFAQFDKDFATFCK